MLEVHFDTMSAVHRMVEAGIEPKHAEAVTFVMREAISSGVATKADIAALHSDMDILRTEMKGEIAALRAELKGEIDELRAELKGEIAALRAELKGEIAALRAEIRSTLRWIMVIGGFIAIAVAEPLVTRLFS